MPPSRSTAAVSSTVDGGRWVESFRLQSLNMLTPLLGQTLQRAAKALARDERTAELATDLSVLRADLIGYETRWQRELDEGFRDWPRAAAPQAAGLSLLSHDELSSQLIGEPATEALERRFEDALDHVSSRLHTLSAALGESARPSNPVAPRQLVNALLRTLPESECSPQLRVAVLAHFERVCTASLADFYARINVQLAESGYALQAGGEAVFAPASALGALEVEQSVAAPGWRTRARERASLGLQTTPRARALQRWAASTAGTSAAPADGRLLQDGEFLAVLSLLQVDPDARPDPDAPDIAGQLRARVLRGAASLGIDSATASLASDQAFATLLAGALVGGLIESHAFDAEASQLLAALAYPLCRQLMTDPGLLDDAEHPARQLLDELAWSLDANAAAAAEDAPLRAAAVQAASGVLSDMHEPERAFGEALAALHAHLAPMRARAALVRRRQVQAVEGRERLLAARTASDRVLAELLAGQRVLPQVHAFLSTQWRHALTQVSLRHGGDSPARARLLDAARALVALDGRAALAQGAEVAQAVLRLEATLREVLLESGLDGAGADEALALLVHALAQPDAARVAPPAADDGLPDGESEPGRQVHGEVGDWLTVGRGAQARRLQIAWRRGDSDCCLLLTRAGQRATDTELSDLGELQARHGIRLHGAHGAVEDLLARWEAAAGGEADAFAPAARDAGACG